MLAYPRWLLSVHRLTYTVLNPAQVHFLREPIQGLRWESDYIYDRLHNRWELGSVENLESSTER